MKLLVTGGAGYIGSGVCRKLIERGDSVIILDFLESGRREAVPLGAELVVGDVGGEGVLSDLFGKNKFDAVMHFAGYIQAGESVADPAKYFDNNLVKPTRMLQTMVKYGVGKIVFSSTAAVYGDPEKLPLDEDHQKRPTNPYGLSKLCFEQALDYYFRKYQLSSVSLRYFNAAGAYGGGKWGEAHVPETHIIPLAIGAAVAEREFKLFGTDYPTVDGTCVRDYIHVEDLAEAHLLALKSLDKKAGMEAYNLGTGRGWSNRQVLSQVEKTTGKKMKVVEMPRREGDAHTLVAGIGKIKKELGWEARQSGLEEVVGSAWEWHRKRGF